MYQYVNSNGYHYYFKKGNGAIEPLIYKQYYRNAHYIGENKTFQNQLIEASKDKITNSEIAFSLKYDKRDLMKYVSNYNSYFDTKNTKTYSKKEHLFKSKAKLGIAYSSLNVTGPFIEANSTESYGSSVMPNFALEFEYIMPFNNNKWSAFIEANYQSFKSSEVVTKSPSFQGIVLERKLLLASDYKMINFPIGMRHYFFINKTNKLFVGAELISTFVFKKEVLTDTNRALDSDGYKMRLGANIGYIFNEKFGIEMKLNQTNYLEEYFNWA